MPTRKWWAATVTGAGALLIALANSRWHIDTSGEIAIIGFVVQRATSYLVPNGGNNE